MTKKAAVSTTKKKKIDRATPADKQAERKATKNARRNESAAKATEQAEKKSAKRDCEKSDGKWIDNSCHCGVSYILIGTQCVDKVQATAGEKSQKQLQELQSSVAKKLEEKHKQQFQETY